MIIVHDEGRLAGKDAEQVAFLILHMEARGVESLSEDNATKASKGVVTVLMPTERHPVLHLCILKSNVLEQVFK